MSTVDSLYNIVIFFFLSVFFFNQHFSQHPTLASDKKNDGKKDVSYIYVYINILVTCLCSIVTMHGTCIKHFLALSDSLRDRGREPKAG